MADRKRVLALAGAASLAVLVVVLLASVGKQEEAPKGILNPSVGSGDLVVYLYEDYQCPHCQQYSLGPAFEHLYETWVATDEIRLMWKHVAFVGPHSMDAAIASQCVFQGDADAWLDFDHAIYALQQDGGEPTPDALLAAAVDLGLPEAGMEECMADREPGKTLLGFNLIDLSGSGAQGTPTIQIGDQTFDPEDTEAVDAAIREALSA